MSKLYQVAVIGAGIGKEHIKGYSTISKKFKVKYVCDLDLERAKKITDNSNIIITNNFDEVLKDDEINIIDICLPPHLHFEFCKNALESGKEVICEKPLVSNLKEVDELILVSQKTKKNIFPVFQYRYGLGTTQLKSIVDAGLAGMPFIASLETHWNRDSNYYSIDWRGTWKGEQGGAILGHAIHIHDLLRMVFGEVSSVYAKLTTRVNNIEVEDCGSLSIAMKSGALVTSSVTLGAAKDTSRLKFCFENLTVESGSSPYKPADESWNFTARNKKLQNKIDDILSKIIHPLSSYAGLFEQIANKLDGKKSDEVTLLDGKKSLEFVTAIYNSAREDKNIKLPIKIDNPYYNSWLP